MLITPSPSSRATAKPFGPFAATRIGTEIGRGGRYPSGGIIFTTAPSMTIDSPSSKPRTCAM